MSIAGEEAVSCPRDARAEYFRRDEEVQPIVQLGGKKAPDGVAATLDQD